MANIHTIVAEQFPQFVRADYPALVEFVSAYYKWLEIQSIGKLEDAVNIDTKLAAIRLQPTYDDVPLVLANFQQNIVVGVTSGAKAIVKRANAANSTTPITLIIQYLTVDAKFVDGEEIYVEQDSATVANNTVRATLQAQAAETTVPSLFISQFKLQLDVNGILTDLSPFNTRYLKHIKEVYSTKGSEQSLLFLLRAVYNAEASITYPNESILRTSDGQWSQETFMTISLYSGTMPAYLIDAVYLESTNASATSQRVNITHYDIIDESTVRVFYRSNTNINPVFGQYVHISNPDTGVTTFRGTVVRSPATITVVTGGANWRVGQAIRFPGAVKDTVARVSVVSTTGAIEALEIVEYGLGHTEFQTVTVSPYKNKPIGIAFDVWPQLITNNIDHSGTGSIAYSATSPIVTGTGTSFTTHLSIGSLIYGLDREYVGKVQSIQSDTSLTLTANAPNTVAETSFRYTTTTTRFEITINDGEVVSNDSMVLRKGSQYVYVAPVTKVPYVRIENTGLTVSEWFESRATLQFEYGTTTTLKGRWLSDRGIISNRSIVIQDSYYYQQFSYVIESDINQKVYSGLAAAVHPAGLKMFTKFALTSSIAIAPTAYTFSPLFTLSFIDTIEVQDALLKHITKLHEDSVTALDSYYWVLVKLHTDAVVATDAPSKYDTKAVADSATPSDFNYKVNTKLRTDSITSVDALSKFDTKAVVDSATPVDAPSKYDTKAVTDSIDTPTDALSKVDGKNVADSIETPADALYKIDTKGVADTATPQDDPSKDNTKAFADSIVTPTDDPSKHNTKLRADEATAEDDQNKEAAKGISDATSLYDGDYTFMVWDNTGLSKIRLNDDTLRGHLLLLEDGGYMLLEDQTPDAPTIYKHLGDGTFTENVSTVVELFKPDGLDVVWDSASYTVGSRDITSVEDSMTKSL